jgi:hypothetical protein
MRAESSVALVDACVERCDALRRGGAPKRGGAAAATAATVETLEVRAREILKITTTTTTTMREDDGAVSRNRATGRDGRKGMIRDARCSRETRSNARGLTNDGGVDADPGARRRVESRRPGRRRGEAITVERGGVDAAIFDDARE